MAKMTLRNRFCDLAEEILIQESELPTNEVRCRVISLAAAKGKGTKSLTAIGVRSACMYLAKDVRFLATPTHKITLWSVEE